MNARQNPANRTRQYLYGLVAVNLAIVVMALAFFADQQREQDRISAQIVEFHAVGSHALQTATLETHAVANILWHRQLAAAADKAPPAGQYDSFADTSIADPLGNMEDARDAVIDSQQRIADPALQEATDAVVRAVDDVLAAMATDSTSSASFGQRQELLDGLMQGLQHLSLLQTEAHDRLIETGRDRRIAGLRNLAIAMALLALIGGLAGIGVARNVAMVVAGRETAMDALRENERRLSRLASNLETAQRIAAIGNWEWEADSGAHRWSDQAFRILGLEPGSVEPDRNTFLQYVHPDDRERVVAASRALFEDGTPLDIEYRIRRADDVERILEVQAEMERDGSGKPVRVVGTAQDITERKGAEQRLAEAVENLNRAQRLAKVGSWEWDIVNDHDEWSDECYRLHGLEPGSTDLAGSDYLAYVHPDDRDSVRRAHEQAIADHKPLDMEFRLAAADGLERIVQTYGEVLFDDSGRALRMSGTIQDVSEIRRREAELRNARDELSRLNAELEQRVEKRTMQLRDAQDELVRQERLATLGQLTATVSHELRNPLGVMRTSLYVLEKKIEEDDPGILLAFDRINRSITRCDNIIDELLDYTRIRILQMEPRVIDQWLQGLLEEQELPPGISLVRDFSCGDLQVSIDPDRLRRAVINVFENACQAMKPVIPNAPPVEGRLSVSTAHREDRVEIAFEDTGPGIADDELENIFEPLYSTKNFGVGLGLAIVRQIMEQHGGGVEAAQNKDGGARFVLWLPLASASENHPDNA